MALADLGGLGAKGGTPTNFNWARPSELPRLLPWLAVLMLLAARPNRCAPAWWILAPLGVVAVGVNALQSKPNVLPGGFGEFLEIALALAMGTAAVWLLGTYLRRKHRFLTFLLTLLALAGFSLVACALKQDWDSYWLPKVILGVTLGVSVLVVSVALSLAGWLCRGRYRPWRLSIGLLAALLVIWLVVLAPIVVVLLLFNPVTVSVLEFLQGVPILAGIDFVLLLPFLALSFASPFYRERLKVLLHLDVAAAPPVMSAAAELVPGAETKL